MTAQLSAHLLLHEEVPYSVVSGATDSVVYRDFMTVDANGKGFGTFPSRQSTARRPR
jgi:hypothetical protein